MSIELWRETLAPYHLAVQELVVKFTHIIKECRDSGMYSPIEAVNGRVKRISSILEKAQRKNIPLDRFTEQMDDIAGIRIICQFVEDIDTVVRLIRSRRDMEVVSEQDYINNTKESGYRSYHVNVLYEVFTMSGSHKIQVEIQIRTMAMNFWATIEHSLRYKYKEELPELLAKRLSTAAEAVLALDCEMSAIRDEIVDAQHLFQEKAAMVADILNNLQNLYSGEGYEDAVLNIQNEFYEVYHNGSLEELEDFGRRLDQLAAVRKVQGLHTFTELGV